MNHILSRDDLPIDCTEKHNRTIYCGEMWSLVQIKYTTIGIQGYLVYNNPSGIRVKTRGEIVLD